MLGQLGITFNQKKKKNLAYVGPCFGDLEP